jgi:hypothetical protein
VFFCFLSQAIQTGLKRKSRLPFQQGFNVLPYALGLQGYRVQQTPVCFCFREAFVAQVKLNMAY